VTFRERDDAQARILANDEEGCGKDALRALPKTRTIANAGGHVSPLLARPHVCLVTAPFANGRESAAPYPTCYPTTMKKTSLYLDESDLVRLRRLAAQEGRSQAEIVRAAIAAYELQQTGNRSFALSGSWEGDGSSIADVSEEELLEGFGG